MAQSKESEQAQKKQSMLSHKDKTIQVIRHIQGKANMKYFNSKGEQRKERQVASESTSLRCNLTTWLHPNKPQKGKRCNQIDKRHNNPRRLGQQHKSDKTC